MWLVNLLGLGTIAAIVWWFWLYKPTRTTAASDGMITITVADGIYQPARIQVPAGKPVTLRFVRQDASPCAGTVVLDDFDISEELPLNQPRDIVITPRRTGSFPFTCQMQMYRGELVVTPG